MRYLEKYSFFNDFILFTILFYTIILFLDFILFYTFYIQKDAKKKKK